MEQRNSRVKKRAGKVIHGAISLHAREKAKEILARFGPEINYSTVLAILDDRKYTRFPVQIRFINNALQPGMFAVTQAISENPDDGYIISIHPDFEQQQDVLPALILYQLVLVNYGDLATANDAEVFGSTILNMPREDYYQLIVELSDTLWSSNT